ncbi:error-prone DNA polymerase [Parvularcula dongshanensis]|uniref:Error-prone DNA polymerase n=1 Tax=Parvularcula dongshanensis TaxID=1173995 RepID=A0A840I7V6_9PROT|nr:error-prone DNA polymerase [Parvularcula dongshanensis]
MAYAELGATSCFTFLTGASRTEELVLQAAELGLPAISIPDRNTFAGIVRGWDQARQVGVAYVVGVRLVFTDGPDVLAWPKDRAAYGRLCRLLTIGKRRAIKGECELRFLDLLGWCEGSVLGAVTEDEQILRLLRKAVGRDAFALLAPRYDGLDAQRWERIARAAEAARVPLLAIGDPLLHRGGRKPLADVMTCIREGVRIDQLGTRALLNAERRLKSPFAMRRLYRDYPEACATTLEVVRRCTFCLSELRYEYPDEVTDGQDPLERLRDRVETGVRDRYPGGAPLKVQQLIAKELTLIEEMGYARYFLTVDEVVQYARSRGILCQGRGSAANSVVCYVLGITSVPPDLIGMLFERFVSKERNEPPDIDVDFEHERREEVIQHLYERFGRHRAGLCCTVIHFRGKAAIREVGKAMGLSDDVITRLMSQSWGWMAEPPTDERVTALGIDLRDRRIRLTLELARELVGFPRHLSQHPGGFVLTRGRLDEIVPIENAAMEDRTVIEWDKDDIDVIGMLKIDVLGLGMLSVIRKAMDLVARWKGTRYDLATLPKECPLVYEQISKGDTVGLFQVESRAQMAFLPKMRPRTFYDLVVEVAVIRPGPIQGGMIHPYLRRRRGEEPVTYASPDLEPVLSRTLGVPLFQEQAMQLAMTVAGFDPGEADALRRALSSFRGDGSITAFKDRFLAGSEAKGYTRDFAEQTFAQIEGFSGYGFPESHAASFAMLAYASGWLRRHHPACYLAAILNSQPMGFYAPAQLVRDAESHGVTVLPIDLNASFWDSSLEPGPRGDLAVRLGFRLIKGLSEEDGRLLVDARGNGYGDVVSVWRRAGLGKRALGKLADADAFASLGLTRRQALWDATAVQDLKPLPLLGDLEADEGPLPALPDLTHGETVALDYVTNRVSLRDHPVRLVRPELPKRCVKASALADLPHGRLVTLAGGVICRQRPGTASGVVFLTLEDEDAVANVVVWPKVMERHRAEVIRGRLLVVSGEVQRDGPVVHLVAHQILDRSDLFDALADFGPDGRLDPTWSSADHARTGVPGSRRDAGRPKEAPTVGHPRDQGQRLLVARDFR